MTGVTHGTAVVLMAAADHYAPNEIVRRVAGLVVLAEQQELTLEARIN